MIIKLQKFLSLVIIFGLLMLNITPVWADEPPAAPTPPPAPTAPPAPTPPPQTSATPPPAPTPPPAQVDPTPTPPPAEATPKPTPKSTPSDQQSSSTTSTPTASPSPTSGGQNSSGSNGSTTVNTGNATNNGSASTIGNNNSASSNSAGAGSGSASVVNSNNGTSSDNNASATVGSSNTTNQTNGATVANNLNQSTVTGHNSASLNVGDSVIKSGDANTTGTVVTALDTNAAGVSVSEFNVNDNRNGDLVLDFAKNCIAGCGSESIGAANTGNGVSSTNSANAKIVSVDNSFQSNDATVGSNLVLKADSGRNEASLNTGGDSTIQTGNANVAGNALTFLNNNLAGNVVFGVVNIFGQLVGDIVLPDSALSGSSCSQCVGNLQAKNSDNGASSTNSATATSSITNNSFQSNSADIANNFTLQGTTGDNVTSGNTGGNSTIKTGNSDVNVQGLTVANSNLDGGNMWLVLVNKAGQWVGQILGAPAGSNFAGSSGTQFTVDQNGNIMATNSNNGANSNNNANVSSTQNNTTSQTNNAKVLNNLDLAANTGHNSASENTNGSSLVTTGDAKIIANLVNFVNNNIIGNGKLIVTVVNVFGSWMGDFITPGQKKQQSNNSNQGNGTGGNTNPGSTTQTQSSSQQSTSQSETVIQNSSSTAVNSTGNVLSATSKNSSFHFTFALGSSAQASNKGQTLVASQNIAKTNSPSLQKPIVINLAWLIIILPASVLAFLMYRKAYHFTL